MPLTAGRRVQPAHRHPEHVGINKERGKKVRGQSVLTDVWIINEATFHHVPAEHSLHSAQDKHEQVLRPLCRLDVAFREKEEINKKREWV